MSQFVTTQDLRVIAGGLRRQQVMDIVRGLAFIGALLLAWISLHPFADLGRQQFKVPIAGNETMTYLSFGCMGVLMLALALRDDWRGLASLVNPAFILFGAWLIATVVLSQDFSTSVRRLALTACVIAVTATIMLLPKTQNELMRYFSIAALVLLGACYLGVVLVPHLSIHLATDAQEWHLAGAWRGVFGHKNVAAAIMAMLVFIGIYTCRSGAWLSGGATTALALLFLLKTGGKSSLALTVVVLMVSFLTMILRPFWLRAAMLLTPLALLNLLSIGTVMSEGLAEIAKALPLDTSFTGRTDIWTFALQSLQSRLLTGYGFAAFWGTEAIRDLPDGNEWAETAAHSHNGYLDAALGTGLPGLALLILVLVIVPLRNFQRADRAGNGGPLLLLLLQLWVFGLYLSSLESFFLDRADPLWFTFLLAVFGLHYLARFRLKA
ncbi:MAG: O-antigen ligase family protein [Bradyrhizobium sp.]|nr:O-antigen ligase family protein [Bradyrhizobium sp.]